jgi:hypothetical protein
MQTMCSEQDPFAISCKICAFVSIRGTVSTDQQEIHRLAHSPELQVLFLLQESTMGLLNLPEESGGLPNLSQQSESRYWAQL